MLHLSCINAAKCLSFISKTLESFGVIRGLFVIFFLGMHVWVYRLYKGRLDDRQKEINRIADENRDLRNFFMKKLEEKM